MAITFLQRRKIQIYLIPIFIIIISITAIVIWYGFLRTPKPIVEPEKILIPPKKVEVDFEVLKSPILEELELFEEISPLEEEIGRENPFIPY